MPAAVYDIDDEALRSARKRIRASMEYLVGKGILSADRMNVALGLATYTSDIAEALGFIANRLQIALYREAVDIVMRGICSVEDVDKALCFGPGLRWALMGPNLIFHLSGGEHGIKGLLHHIGPSAELWWADMADWKKWPEGWADLAQEGVVREMAGRPAEGGRTVEDISRWRDDGLIEILKLHNKL